MFLLDKLTSSTNLSIDKLTELLKTDKTSLYNYEKYYKENLINNKDGNNLFNNSSKEVSEKVRTVSKLPEFDENYLKNLINRITEELITVYKGEQITNAVTNEDLNRVPLEVRPQLTGTLVKADLKGLSYKSLLYSYYNFLKEKNPEKKKYSYFMFRQGLDILDLDIVLYEMLGKNKNSIGYWFPTLKNAVSKQNFFKLPKTKIIKVPLPILQLTRLEYTELTLSTLKIVDDFCYKVFELEEDKSYFIKTGTYSSKFDFRNAKVTGAKEVRELGEYLLFIQNQACMMAGPLTQPSIYGISTTNEWCVREFIEDVENAPTIYKGLPLHNEIRIFIDFDTDEILGYSPYWKTNLLEKHFGNALENSIKEGKTIEDSPHTWHDFIIYQNYKEVLQEKYDKSIDLIIKNIQTIIPDISLQGQWSLDIMQNGDDFYIIDMALAQESALRECIPEEKRKFMEENWLPEFKNILEVN